MASRTPGAGTTGDMQETAVPTLRVMRLQNPTLHSPTAGCLDSQPIVNNALCLPDSLDVYCGENFTAYIGVINGNPTTPIRKLTVTAQLQSPTVRWQLKSPLDGSASTGGPGYGGGGMDVPPLAGVDAVVSHAIEEPGQHILRVEVSSQAADGNLKTFRKFYRFQVTHPVVLREKTARAGDASCWVTLSVEYTNNAEYANSRDVMVISDVEFKAEEGLTAKCVGRPSIQSTPGKCLDASTTPNSDALDLYDQANILQRGTVVRYLFHVEATSEHAKLRGLAASDLLGNAVVTWCMSMGEQGKLHSPPIYCPAAPRGRPVFQSGLSVDVASSPNKLAHEYPVTVEPIDPPRRMVLEVPTMLQFLVVNHSPMEKALQLQFRSNTVTGLAVYEQSSVSLGPVPGNGGSKVATVNFVALTAGLLRLDGCYIVDVASDNVIRQPPLLDILVDQGPQ